MSTFNLSSIINKIGYRIRQAQQQLGGVEALCSNDHVEVQKLLASVSSEAHALFYTMSLADQQHSLRVCRGLQTSGCQDVEMLRAALLHDVGKAQGRVPFWTRPAIVLGKLCIPHMLAQLCVVPTSATFAQLPLWRRTLSYAWWHADVGANLCEAVGLSKQTVLYIRTHHQAHGPAAALHAVDDVS